MLLRTAICSTLLATPILATPMLLGCSKDDLDDGGSPASAKDDDSNASDDSDDEDDDNQDDASSDNDAQDDDASSGDDSLIVGEETPDPGSADAGACVAEHVPAELEPVILAFAFDVSGSMGKGDFPYHDRSLKWEPVVAATKAFFDDPSSTGLSASLTLFPVDGENSAVCSSASYSQPVVSLTELPSQAFADAIDAATPETANDWLGGTPTWAVLEGTLEWLQESIAQHPEAKHAIVLVTDGSPAGCGSARNDIDDIADFVGGYADVAPTYVIGVANPETEEEPDPPNVVANLDLLAQQGGTEAAFIIDTGDADQTAADFSEVVNSIRGNSLSCTITIPPSPTGETLDTKLVNVTYNGSEGPLGLAYSADCSQDEAWRFDDPESPSTIELCDATCTAVREDPEASLEVEFGCLRRVMPEGAH